MSAEQLPSERLAAQNNSVVSHGIKLEFVNDELDSLRRHDPKKADYINFQIARARRIMAIEMQRCVDVGLGVENANTERVDAIIDKLFTRFVCQ